MRIFIIAILLLLCGCDPRLVDQLLLQNSSDGTLRVVLSQRHHQDATFFIPRDSVASLVIFERIGVPHPLDDSEMRIFFDTLRVFRNDSLVHVEPPYRSKSWIYREISRNPIRASDDPMAKHTLIISNY